MPIRRQSIEKIADITMSYRTPRTDNAVSNDIKYKESRWVGRCDVHTIVATYIRVKRYYPRYANGLQSVEKTSEP